MTSPRVVVLGDVMLDVVVRASEPINPTSDTRSNVRIGRGGSGANIAVELARGDCDVRYVGAAGDDVAAQLCIDDLHRASVATELQVVDASTGVVVALVGENGQRTMMTDRGANSALTVQHVLAVLDEPFDHLHVSGYCVLDEATREVAVAALRRASECGRTSSVDVCSVGPLRRVGANVFADVTRGATTMFANEEEARAFSGADTLDGALEYLGERYREVVVTRGADGAVARVNEVNSFVASQRHDVVDTTGAGDAATGAYLAARLARRSIAEALHRAMMASAAVVGGLGSRG